MKNLQLNSIWSVYLVPGIKLGIVATLFHFILIQLSEMGINSVLQRRIQIVIMSAAKWRMNWQVWKEGQLVS